MSEQGSVHGTSTADSSVHSTASSSTTSSQDRTFKPYGYGQLFPSFSPRSSGAGDTDFDWTMAEEKILRDVAQWLSPADLRRARLVCKTWYSALATLTTKAATPAETLVPQWQSQLEAMLQAFPCLHELTISSKLSCVAAQQLGVLATAKKLQVLNIPHAQALQDRSLLALQPLASHLRELRINGASSLGKRSLLLLSVLAQLEVLELKNCGKISWFELQQAWRAACISHEAQAAADAAGAGVGANLSSSGGGSNSSRFSSSGGGLGKLGSWLPTGRLFRTSSPSSSSIQSALAWQRTGSSGLFAKVHDLARGTSSAAAVAVAQLGIGAVGNGRSSCGGGLSEAPARSLLHRKQKEGAAAASGNSLLISEEAVLETNTLRFASSGCFPVRNGLLRMMTRSASQSTPDTDSPRPASMLSRVGSLVWHNSSAASAGTGNTGSFIGSSGPSLAAQASCVQAALLAYIAQQEQTATAAASSHVSPESANTASTTAPVDAAAHVQREPSARPERNSATGGGGSSSGSSSKPSTASDLPAAKASMTAATNSQQVHAGGHPAAVDRLVAQAGKPAATGNASGISSSQTSAPYKPRRRTTGDRSLPAMPFTKLASLSFTCSDATLRSPGQELAAVAALTSLTSLEISKCKLPDAVFVHLQSLSRLAKLKLTGLWSMGDAGLQHVAQLTALNSLALSEAMHVTEQGLQVLTAMSGLTSLALGFTQELGPGALARVVSSLPKLQCLEVAAPSWGDLDCEMLAEAAPLQPQTQPALDTRSRSSIWSTAAAAAEAGAASKSSPAPQMLWDLAGPSRSNSSRQLLPPAARANSSWRLQASSFSSIRSHSFGSFSLPTGPQQGLPPLPAQPLLVLRLHGSRALTSRGMAVLKRLPELHTLMLENSREVRAAEVISQGLLPAHLACLTLRSLPFGNLFSGCVSMPCCSSRLTKLELVSLEGVHDGQLRRLLSFFPNVAELSLAGCSELGDPVLQHMALLPKLRQLNLSGCSIVGQGLEHLQHLLQLRVLGLRGCSQLCDAGLALLVQLTSLEELDVAECSSVSEQALLHVAQNTPRLVRLDVSGCRGVTRALISPCPHYLNLRHSL